MWDQLCELAQVLDHGSEVELVFCAVRTSKTEAIEAQNSPQVGEQHLDFLAGIARGDVGIGCGDVARYLTCALMRFERAIFRVGWLGVHRGFSVQAAQSCFRA